MYLPSSTGKLEQFSTAAVNKYKFDKSTKLGNERKTNTHLEADWTRKET